MLTSARQDNALSNPFDTTHQIVRNGLTTLHLPDEEPVAHVVEMIKMHVWLGEAVLEDMRQRVTGSECVGYVKGVAVLRTLKDLDPTLEQDVERLAISKEGPAVAIAKIEQLLGPLGSEKLDAVMSESGFDQDGGVAAVRHFLAQNLPADKVQDGLALFDRHYQKDNKLGGILGSTKRAA
jgi:hypothetical protein